VKIGRVTPAPDVFDDARLLASNEVVEAQQKIREAKSVEAADLQKFDNRVQEVAVRTWTLPEDVDLPFYVTKWKKLKRCFAMPRLRGYSDDMAVMLGQPEIQSSLLGRWLNPPARPSGPKPAYAGSKAVLLVMGALGIGPHVDNNYEVLAGNARLREVCSWALDRAATAAKRVDESFRLAGCVESVLKHLPALVDTLGRLPMEANVQMLRSLAAMYPNLPICTVGGIDGAAFAAWAKQRWGRSEQDEAKLTKNAPSAGFRSYNRRNGKKQDAAPGEVVDAKIGKVWRGYHLVVLVDYCSGRPIVWSLVNAKWDEAKQLRELLRVLYELWPDCPLTTIVGDGAWDEKWAHEVCEVGYGLHLVASRTIDSTDLDAEHKLSEGESEVIDYFDGKGQAFCRDHKQPMKLLGNEAPKREGLVPGEASPESQFRLRFKCDSGCGTPSLQMARHWTALAYYPHTPNGKVKRYAERYALLAHRNVCESLFNALKVGHGMATVGADRLRLTDLQSVRALVDLSFCMGTALMLGQERNRLGVSYDTPPAEQLAA